jgi:hypothetical protein
MNATDKNDAANYHLGIETTNPKHDPALTLEENLRHDLVDEIYELKRQNKALTLHAELVAFVKMALAEEQCVSQKFGAVNPCSKWINHEAWCLYCKLNAAIAEVTGA